MWYYISMYHVASHTETRAVNVDALEEELARVRPQLEELQMLHGRLSGLTKAHDKTCDELRVTRETLRTADDNLLEMRRDLEECLAKMRSMQDRQAELFLVEKEASFLRGTLESRQRQHDEVLHENAALVLHVEDAQKAMFAATQELRALQQRALAGTVTRALVEEVEALRMEAKEAASKRDLALQDVDKVKLELAGVKARLVADRKVAAEHRSCASPSALPRAACLCTWASQRSFT